MKKLIVFSAFVLLTAVNLNSCSSGGGGSSPPPFSQADLVGTWHVSILQSSPTLSPEPGWFRGTGTIDGSGNITFTTFYSSASGTSPVQNPSGTVWTIDPWTGMISESGPPASANPDFHGKLASNKNLIVGTATNLNSQSTITTIQLRVIQKLIPGVTYSSSDLANKNFTMHQIDSGASDIWTHATGSTDGSGNVSLGVITKPTFTESGGPIGVLSIDSQGIVRLNTNSMFRGVMSPDKTYMVATETATGGDIYRLTIVQMTGGQTFALSDLAGSWHVHGLINGIPAWVYQSLSINATGYATITSQLDSMGVNIPPDPTQAAIDASGNLTDIADPSLHGTLSSGKDMLVTTQTITDGPYYMLGVTVK